MIAHRHLKATVIVFKNEMGKIVHELHSDFFKSNVLLSSYKIKWVEYVARKILLHEVRDSEGRLSYRA